MEKNQLIIFKSDLYAQHGTNIEYTQLKTNLDKALNLVPVLEDDLGKFIQKISTKTF
jgi:hypothetical protein